MSHRARLLDRGDEAAALSPRLRVRRAGVLMAMTALAPGSAQLAVGRRWVGAVALTAWLAVLVALGFLVVRYGSDRVALIGLAADADALMRARLALVGVGLLWLALFVDTWRLARPFTLPRWRRAAFMAVNTLVVLGVVAGVAYAAQVAGTQRSVVREVFTATETTDPLHGRYNILLMGSDSGADRTGYRPDSVVVVSIDATTGRSVMISLPRNLQNVPFVDGSPMQEVYPNGFSCGSECLLNAVHTAGEERFDLYPDSEDPGLEATIDAVEGVTDLTMNYHVIVNMQGFKSLVDAVGGVEMEVKTRLAKFGQADAYKQVYIEPGRQVLDGSDALWYARSRVQSDDYTRMGRQKCLMAAMLEQLSPQTVLLNAQSIARSGAELLSTDMPASELGAFADLALKARGSTITTVSLVPPEVPVTTPDYEVVHQLIAEAIAQSESGARPSPEPQETIEPTPQSPGVPAAEPDETQDPELTQAAANNADDLASSC